MNTVKFQLAEALRNLFNPVVVLNRRIQNFVRRTAILTASVFLLIGSVFCQYASDGQKSKGFEPGTPAGSYSLSGFENINLYNGNLNFTLPLLNIGGRGRVATPINVSFDSSKWHVDLLPSEIGSIRINHIIPVNDVVTGSVTEYWCQNLAQTVSPDGCASEVRDVEITYQLDGRSFFSTPDAPRIFQITPDSPSMDMTVTAHTVNFGGDYNTAVLLTRLTFVSPDGTVHQLRDVSTDGRPNRINIYINPAGQNQQFTAPFDRGTIFKTAEGENITFVSDQNIYDLPQSAIETLPPVYPSGFLYFGDGTVYRIDNGSISWKRDVNGNTIQGLTDSVGRTVTGIYHDFGSNPQDPDETSVEWQVRSDANTIRQIKVYRTKLGKVLRSDYPSIRNTNDMFPELSGIFVVSGDDYNPDNLVSRIVLPDGREYKLRYNPYGELARVELPTGSAIEYDFYQAIPFPVTQDHSTVFRPLLERRVYSTGGSSANNTIPDQKQTYVRSSPDLGISQVEVRNFGKNEATGQIQELAKEVHSFYGQPYITSRALYTPWNEGKEYKTETFAPASSTPLRIAETEWENPNTVAWQTSPNWVSSNPRIKSITTHITEGSNTLTSKNVFGYDDTNRFNNRTDEWVYDFGVGSIPGRLLKHTQIGYLKVNPENNIDYTSEFVHIYGLPSWSKVFDVKVDGSEQLISQTETKYDEPAYPVLTYTGTPSGWTDPQTTARGNSTTVRTWYAEENRWIETHAQFDQFGNVRKAWDASGDPTRFTETEYSPDYQYAFPTKVTTPPLDPTGVHGSSEPSSVTSSYNFYTGQAVGITDEFGQTTTTEYNDLLGRPTHSIPPAGGAQATVEYGDTIGNLYVKTRKQLDESKWDESTTFYDGLGRAVRTQAKDSQGDVYVDTHYDSLGRVDRVTNPYRAGDTVYWNKSRFDGLGRPVEIYAPATQAQIELSETNNNANLTSLGVTSFDLSTVSGFVGTVVTATDASGRPSRSITNSLGQLIRVDEPTTVNGTFSVGTIVTPNQPTFYKYDAFGKMVQVTQGGQNRYFKYDSFGHLSRVNQPEQDQNPDLDLADTFNTQGHWTAGFVYDILGNVVRATDANGVNIVSEYDKAGRVIKRCYTKPDVTTSATTCAQISTNDLSADTPTVEFWYDGKGLPAEQLPNYAKGKLTKVDNGVSASLYSQFDNFGRLTQSSQITDGQTYTSNYQYNLSGALVQETYPSGRIVKNDFQSDGDLADVVSKKTGGSVFVPYVSNFSYSASGGVSQMQLGNGKWETAKFNERLQLTDLGLGASASDAGLWKVHYEYGELSQDGSTVEGSKNTGNIARQTLTIPGTSFVQSYRYDSLYRLTEAVEKTGTTQNWIQNWGYDRYGNRNSFTQNIAGNNTATNPTVNQNTNRFNANQGFVYDHNGNVINDVDPLTTLTRTFVFNGDNKQTEVKNANGDPIGRYVYDGEGKRVKKIVGDETTVFVYSSGKLVAEYSTQTEPNPAINYTTTDHLGSPRIITDQFGQVTSRRDFMPFGEQIDASVGNRSNLGIQYSSTGDALRQKFTGYQKDDETSRDFAEARMYENRYGRFTAVDPLLASGKSVNPQSFNRYTYVGDNPLQRVDPKGRDWWDVTDHDGNRHISWFDEDPDEDSWVIDQRWTNYFYQANDKKWYSLDPNSERFDTWYTKDAARFQYGAYVDFNGDYDGFLYDMLNVKDLAHMAAGIKAGDIDESLYYFVKIAAINGVGAGVGKFICSRATSKAILGSDLVESGVDKATTALVPKAASSLGRWGEARLAQFLGGNVSKWSKPLATSIGGRVPDFLIDGVAYEAKAGLNVGLTSAIRTQALKDAELIASKQVKAVQWHFFQGAQQELLDFLTQNNIQYVLH